MARITALKVRCPECGRRAGRDCQGSRIPSANSFGGGWGGPSDLQRPHQERVVEAKRLQAEREAS
jgi:hypothetical protein